MTGWRVFNTFCFSDLFSSESRPEPRFSSANHYCYSSCPRLVGNTEGTDQIGGGGGIKGP